MVECKKVPIKNAKIYCKSKIRPYSTSMQKYVHVGALQIYIYNLWMDVNLPIKNPPNMRNIIKLNILYIAPRAGTNINFIAVITLFGLSLHSTIM